MLVSIQWIEKIVYYYTNFVITCGLIMFYNLVLTKLSYFIVFENIIIISSIKTTLIQMNIRIDFQIYEIELKCL